MELNEIEKVLKTKAKRELEIIVENFTKEVANLCEKYDRGVEYTWLKLPLKKDINGNFDIEDTDLKTLKSKLEYLLNDAFLGALVKEKSKELVKKLDIL
tara:strand:- start:205 stop:501 length:297 start_codon:yes stop_codon:yes gene_type:complete